MTNFRKILIILAVVVATVVLFFVIKVFGTRDDSYIRVFKEYQQKGKSYQFNVDDVRKGFE
ncbi:hypothetical protein [Phosphitispora sp. TUW77]|uniref:hypothetical protein n=1 Tax=Phosphitispora sp. TUW77 TaxID=3152361 RepID=UPI003AB262FB